MTNQPTITLEEYAEQVPDCHGQALYQLRQRLWNEWDLGALLFDLVTLYLKDRDSPDMDPDEFIIPGPVIAVLEWFSKHDPWMTDFLLRLYNGSALSGHPETGEMTGRQFFDLMLSQKEVTH